MYVIHTYLIMCDDHIYMGQLVWSEDALYGLVKLLSATLFDTHLEIDHKDCLISYAMISLFP